MYYAINEVINVPPEPWLYNSRNLACVSTRKYVKEGNVGRLRARGGHLNRTSVFCWGGKKRQLLFSWKWARLNICYAPALTRCTAQPAICGAVAGSDALCACMVYVLASTVVWCELNCAHKRGGRKLLQKFSAIAILRTTFLYIAVSRAVQPIG